MTGLASKLQLVVPPDSVLTGGGLDGYQVHGVLPRAAVQASSPEHVAAVLAQCSAEGWTVAPWGAGTLQDLGNPPSGVDVVLDLQHLDAVVDYQPDDLTVTVQAGCTLGRVHELLAEREQSLALDVPLPERTTVGGALASNLSGPRRTRYGTARDLVIGIEFALTDGSLARSGGRVVKNVAGYDLAKAQIGALGTLGVITEATFKLWPAPAWRSASLAVFPDLVTAHTTAMALLNGRLMPTAVELIGPWAHSRLRAVADETLGTDGWLLVALFSGLPAAVRRQIDETVVLCHTHGAGRQAQFPGSSAEQFFAGLRDFGRTSGAGATQILCVATLPSEVPAGVAALEEAGRLLKSAPAVVARPAAGLAYGYWDDVESTEVVGAVATARARLAAIAGNLVVERAPASVEALDRWGLDGDDLEVMRRLKEAFDPGGVLNPGRFAGGL